MPFCLKDAFDTHPEYTNQLKKDYLDVLTLTKPEIFAAAGEIWDKAYGAWIFQAEGDANVSGTRVAEGHSALDVSEYVSTVIAELKKRGAFNHPDVVYTHMEPYALATVMSRSGPLMTSLTVASLMKYIYMVLQIRDDYYGVNQLSWVEGMPVLNQDWLYDTDLPILLFQENFQDRDLAMLRYLGSELHMPLTPERADELKPTDSPAERFAFISSFSRFRAYKTFVYDRSEKVPHTSESWLRSRALRFVRYVGSSISPDQHYALTQCVSLYTASMRTSTTGAVLGSVGSVFAPKSIEADRLLTNLFTHHIRQLTIGDPCITDGMIDSVVAKIPGFIESEHDNKSNSRKSRGGRAENRDNRAHGGQ